MVLVVLFWGCFGGFVSVVPVYSVVPVVLFRRFRFGVSGFSTCQRWFVLCSYFLGYYGGPPLPLSMQAGSEVKKKTLLYTY